MSQNNNDNNDNSSSSNIHWTGVAFVVALLAWFVTTLYSSTTNNNISTCQDPHDNLLIGYKILRHTLQKESELKYLKILKQTTTTPLNFINGRSTREQHLIKEFMTRISTASSARSHELDDLFATQKPTIELSKTPISDIGDAIQDKAEQMGVLEMLMLPSSTWSIRFWFLQAQATRMIAAISTSLAHRDPNPIRVKWLHQLAKEYETLRNDIAIAASSSSS